MPWRIHLYSLSTCIALKVTILNQLHYCLRPGMIFENSRHAHASLSLYSARIERENVQVLPIN